MHIRSPRTFSLLAINLSIAYLPNKAQHRVRDKTTQQSGNDSSENSSAWHACCCRNTIKILVEDVHRLRAVNLNTIHSLVSRQFGSRDTSNLPVHVCNWTSVSQKACGAIEAPAANE